MACPDRTRSSDPGRRLRHRRLRTSGRGARGFTTCSEPNAFVSPSEGQVRTCYELFALTGSVFAGLASSDEEVGEADFIGG